MAAPVPADPAVHQHQHTAAGQDYGATHPHAATGQDYSATQPNTMTGQEYGSNQPNTMTGQDYGTTQPNTMTGHERGVDHTHTAMGHEHGMAQAHTEQPYKADHMLHAGEAQPRTSADDYGVAHHEFSHNDANQPQTRTSTSSAMNTNATSNELLPCNPPLVLMPSFAVNEISHLTIEQVVYVSGGNFFVKDMAGNLIVSSIGKEWSSRGKKIIYDNSSKAIFDIKDDIFTTHHAMTATRDGTKLFKIGYYPSRHGGVDKFEVTFFEPRSKARVQIEIAGDWITSKAEFRVAPHGTLIAHVYRTDQSVTWVSTENPKTGAKQEEQVTTIYRLDVAPNVDLAIISAMCMCCASIRSNVVDD